MKMSNQLIEPTQDPRGAGPSRLIRVVGQLNKMRITKISKRQVFVSSREKCTDAEYLQQLSIPSNDQDMALCLRRTMARQCGISAEYLCADESPRLLMPIFNESYDESCFMIDIEEMIGRSINMEGFVVPQLFDLRLFWWKRPGAATIGEWTKEFIKRANHGLESTSAPPAAGTLETHP